MAIVRFSVTKGLSGDVITRMGQVARVKLVQQPIGTVDSRPAFTDRDGVLSLPPISIDTATNTPLRTFEFPFGPKEVTYQGSALEYQEVQRPGLQPLLKSMNPKNRSVTLSAVITNRETGGLTSVEQDLKVLSLMAREDRDIEFIHGGVRLGFFVRIVELTITSRERTLQGDISRAVVDISLQESKQLNVNVISMRAITAEPSTDDGNPDPEPKRSALDVLMINRTGSLDSSFTYTRDGEEFVVANSATFGSPSLMMTFINDLDGL
jgi:phage protein U